MIHNCNQVTEPLPELLQIDLDRLNLSVIEVLFSNPRKGRWTLKVKGWVNGMPAVLKWCHPDAAKEYQEGFQREKDFYRNFGAGLFLPHPFMHEPNLLLMEYVPALSLRQYMIVNAHNVGDFGSGEVLVVLKCLLKQLKEFHSAHRGFPDPAGTAKQLTSFWLKLFLSGPMGTKRSRVEEWLAKATALIISRVVQKMFRRDLERNNIGEGIVTCGFIHGDLHCNNILITIDHKKVFLIDFENVERNSFWILDLLYLWPMVLKLAKGEKLKKEVFNLLAESDLFSNDREWVLFKKWLRIMRVAIFFNRRFAV